MKKILCAVFIQFIVFCLHLDTQAQFFSGGDGTPDNPYQISEIYQLQSVYQFLDKNFVLIDNIDASDTQYWDSNLGFRSFKGTFTGSFDGAGFTIHDLFQNRPDGVFGIFDTLGTTAVIKNLFLQNFNLDGTGGAIAKVNYGNLSNIQVNATITGSNIGGIVRDNYSAIKSSNFTGLIRGGNIGGVAHTNKIAAIIEDSGFNATLGNDNDSHIMGGICVINDGTINRITVNGTIRNNRRRDFDARIGGIVFENNGIISFSEMNALLEGFRDIGGIAFTNSQDAIISDVHMRSNIGIRNDGVRNNECNDEYNVNPSRCRANDIGGLLGVNQGSIINVLISSGIVDASSGSGSAGIDNRDNNTFGKVFGVMESSFIPTNVYYNANNSVGIREVGTGSDDGITGWPESGLIGEVVRINLEGFDFENVWRTTEGFPELRIDEFKLPQSPTLNTPQNNSDDISLLPNLAWQEVSGAATYHIQVSESPSFQTRLLDIGGLTSTSYQLNIPLNLGSTYYWRVRSENYVGESLWSSVWNFTTLATQPPISKIALYSPENTSTEQQRTVDLLWQQDLLADGYQLQVAKGSWSLQNLIVNDPLVENNTYTLSQLEYNEGYFWRVRNIVGESYGEWSDVWSFQTHNILMYIDFLVSDLANNSKMLTVGTASYATQDFDLGLDILAPPAPPDGSFDARISTQNFGYFAEFKPETEDSTVWTMKFKPEVNFGPIVIEWDPSLISNIGIFRLADRINGEYVNVDLSTQNSITINEPLITELDIKFYLTKQVSQSYKNNWDLISLPVDAEHSSYDEFYANAMEGTLFSFDGTYQLNDRLNVGTGYWLNFNDEEIVTYEGFAVDNLNLSLNQYWNLIGSSSSNSIVVDPEDIIIPGTLYGYNGTYTNSSVIEPGKGYWIASLTEGEISLQPSGPAIAATQHEQFISEIVANTIHRLDFLHLIDGSERLLRSIYFVKSINNSVHPLSLTLPPKPPTSGFDVRLNGDRWVTDDRSASVQLQVGDTESQVYVRSGIEFSTSEVIFYGNDSVTLGKEIVSSQLVPIPEGTVDISVETNVIFDEEIPEKFTLFQNYPNPFNPETQISYSLAQRETVKIEVFTMTGQRVALLIDEEQNAGIHSVSFDASNFATGAYMYRITAGNFSDSKLMSFVK